MKPWLPWSMTELLGLQNRQFCHLISSTRGGRLRWIFRGRYLELPKVLNCAPYLIILGTIWNLENYRKPFFTELSNCSELAPWLKLCFWYYGNNDHLTEKNDKLQDDIICFKCLWTTHIWRIIQSPTKKVSKFPEITLQFLNTVTLWIKRNNSKPN